MTDGNLDPQLKSNLDELLQPYVDRLAALEKSQQQKDTDIVLLSNAVENLMRQLDEYREKIKKLPKGDLISEIRTSD